MKQDTFIFHRSWMEAVTELDESAQLEVLKGIIYYCLDGVEPEDSMARFAFLLLKKMIDNTYANRLKKQEAGRKGGYAKARNRKEKLAEASKTVAKPSTDVAEASTAQAYATNGLPKLVIDNCKLEKDIPKGISKKKSAKRFSPPTPDEVRAYVNDGNYNVDPERFCDFYSSKDWMVGKNKMKDWKACVRNWDRSQRKESTAKVKKQNQFNSFHQREYDFDNLEAELFAQQFGGGEND